MSKSKNKIGIVLKKSGDKSYNVRVDSLKPHPVYKKVVRNSTKFLVHYSGSQNIVGKKVTIVQTRPISKNISWKIQSIIEGNK